MTLLIVPLFIAVIAIANFQTVYAPPAGGFSGYYDPLNWALNQDGGDGSVDAVDAPDNIRVIGSNTGVHGPGGSIPADTSFTRAIPCDGTVVFDWGYETFDIAVGSNIAGFDPAGFSINGVFTQITVDAGGVTQGGDESVPVSAGQVFGFVVRTDDGIGGRAELTIDEFTAPLPEDCLPEPEVFEKTLVEDPAKSNIECTTGMPIGALTTTMCTFLLEYTGDSLLIVDTVPAEWEFVSQTGTCDVGPAGKGNPSKSATKIDCGVTDSLSEEFTFQTRQSPGKNNVKFAPTSCDKELKLNESALALDPITMEIIKTSNMIGTPTVDDPNDTDCDQVENDKDQCQFSDPINFGPIDRWGCDTTQTDD